MSFQKCNVTKTEKGSNKSVFEHFKLNDNVTDDLMANVGPPDARINLMNKRSRHGIYILKLHNQISISVES